MALTNKLMYVALALLLVVVFAIGCTSSSTASPDTGKPPVQVASAAGAANEAPPPAYQKAGNPKAPVKLLALYPLNKDHKPIADYLLTLPKKFGEKKVFVEVYDMQSPDGQKKWSASGLSCAGVFVNGKTTWDVLRAGKKEKVNFIKRMGTFWTSEDLEAVIKSQLADPKKTPVVPPAKPAKAAKPADKGK